MLKLFHVTTGYCLKKFLQQLFLLLWGRIKTRLHFLDIHPGPAKNLPAIYLTLSNNLSNLRVFVSEHLPQKEYSALYRIQPLEKDQECKRQGLINLENQ